MSYHGQPLAIFDERSIRTIRASMFENTEESKQLQRTPPPLQSTAQKSVHSFSLSCRFHCEQIVGLIYHANFSAAGHILQLAASDMRSVARPRASLARRSCNPQDQ